jgi:hypothetical protein
MFQDILMIFRNICVINIEIFITLSNEDTHEARNVFHQSLDFVMWAFEQDLQQLLVLTLCKGICHDLFGLSADEHFLVNRFVQNGWHNLINQTTQRILFVGIVIMRYFEELVKQH